jgi:hypothetical protein
VSQRIPGHQHLSQHRHANLRCRYTARQTITTAPRIYSYALPQGGGAGTGGGRTCNTRETLSRRSAGQGPQNLSQPHRLNHSTSESTRSRRHPLPPTHPLLLCTPPHILISRPPLPRATLAASRARPRKRGSTRDGSAAAAAPGLSPPPQPGTRVCACLVKENLAPR